MDRIVAQQTGAGPSSEAYLVTGSSDFLSSSRFGRPEYRRGVHTEGVAAVVRHRSGVGLYTNYAGVPVIGAYRWIKERELALLVEVGQRQAFAPARRLLTRIIAFGAATMLLLLLGVRWIGRRVARPISAVSRAAERLAAGDFSARAPRGGPDEVGTLARSFNSMTGQLRSLYEDLEGQIQLSTEALQALEQSKSLLKSIVDNSTTLIAVIDAHDRLMLANHAFEDLFGVGEEAAIGSQLDEVVPEAVAKASDEAIAAVRDRGAVVDREISWGEGSALRAFLSVWFPLPDPERGGTGIGVIATEVTARKRAEEEQLRLESQLRHAQKLESLGVLAGGIAHDFNNILAAILGFADLARGSGSPDVDESLEHIVTAAQRAAELTTQMLAYAGRATFRMERVDLNESIMKLSELVSVSLPKTVTLITQLDPEPVIVEADPSQVSQIVMNLLTNAGQAVGSASGVVEIRTRRVSRGVGPGRVVLTVSDSGEGMPSEVLDRIFDPFFTTKEAGTGLGLAAVLGIVKGMDGTIEVSSEPDAGTTFTVTFPLCEDVPMQIDSARATRSPAAAGSTVLVVDDEPAVRGFTRKVLERYGFQVLEAADGIAGALAYELDRDRIRAVVLDMSMPGMSGAEVFDTMRRLRPNVPVVFTSGYDPADAMAALASDGAVRFIQKPYRPAALVEALGDLLNGEDAAQEICS
jgi:PAS domain S-box-containing protein